MSDAGTDARVLTCDVPRSAELVPSASGSNAGVPLAGIGWTDGACVFYGDDGHPDIVLLVADLTGFLSGGLVAAPGRGWRTVSSSEGLASLPRDTDIDVVVERDGVRVELTFRVEGDTVVLLAMRLG